MQKDSNLIIGKLIIIVCNFLACQNCLLYLAEKKALWGFNYVESWEVSSGLSNRGLLPIRQKTSSIDICAYRLKHSEIETVTSDANNFYNLTEGDKDQLRESIENFRALPDGAEFILVELYLLEPRTTEKLNYSFQINKASIENTLIYRYDYTFTYILSRDDDIEIFKEKSNGMLKRHPYLETYESFFRKGCNYCKNIFHEGCTRCTVPRIYATRVLLRTDAAIDKAKASLKVINSTNGNEIEFALNPFLETK